MRPDLLALVYGWFTEDFDTLDLKEAKAFARRAARLTANFETASNEIRTQRAGGPSQEVCPLAAA